MWQGYEFCERCDETGFDLSEHHGKFCDYCGGAGLYENILPECNADLPEMPTIVGMEKAGLAGKSDRRA